MRWLALCLLTLGCTPAEMAQWWRPPERIHFVTPTESGPVVADQMPILVRVPQRLMHATPTLRLDGRPAGDAGVLRRRWWSGKEADYISALSTQHLSPGQHTLSLSIADDLGETWTVARSFEFAPRPDVIGLYLTDAHGQPRHGRVEFFDMDGARVDVGSPGDELADPTERDSVRSSVFIVDGVGQVFLRPGEYQVIGSGGVRDGIAEHSFTVPGTTKIVLEVPRLIDTPDAVTADLHVHTARSGDAFVSDMRRWRSLLAAGVEVGVVTEHNWARDPQPAISMLGLQGRLVLVPGVEFRIGPSGESIGHGNTFPVAPGVELPRPGTKTPAEVVASWRSHWETHPVGSEAALVQLNHPRGIQFWPDRGHQPGAHALFTELDLKPGIAMGEQADARLYEPDGQRGERIADVDALEILNRFSLDGWRSVRQDWFDLMNQGWFPTGTGNADSHSVELERPGFPVNLVEVGQAGRHQPDALVRAIRAGRVSVSTGPLVQLRVSTPQGAVGTPGDLLRGPLTEVEVEVEVVAAPWVPVPELRIIVDGRLHRRIDIDASAQRSTLRATWRETVEVKGDTWILAEAGWSVTTDEAVVAGPYAKVAPGHLPIGFTNPVLVDGEGDGRWYPRISPNLP